MTPTFAPAQVEYTLTQLRDLRVLTRRREEKPRPADAAMPPAVPPAAPMVVPATEAGDTAPAEAAARINPECPVAIEVAGQTYEPTQRFWSSLFHRFGLSGNVFRYFRYEEVLRRVVEANPDDRLRLCVEKRDGGAGGRGAGRESLHAGGRLLAVSNPRRPLLTYDQALDLARKHHGEQLTYGRGVITSHHTPRSGENDFAIGGDAFRNRFVVEAPVDGFGQPRIYLSLLRQVCSNGAIGYSRAFRSDIRLGEDVAYTLERALGQFDHDEGFAALRQRFDSAQKSWASVKEVLLLQKTLTRVGSDGAHNDAGYLHDGLVGSGGSQGTACAYINRLNHLAGDLHALYGMANLEGLSAKRQRVLPARCRVYDLINFASEIATHKAGAEGRLRLQAYIGTLISEEYDLEGTAEKVPEFADLFLNQN